MIFTLTGENSFALRQRLKELVNKFIAKYGELAVERFDAEEAEASAIVEAIQALPFLISNKMVIVRNGNTNPHFANQIEQSLSSVPTSTELILHEPKLDKRTAYFKVLKQKSRFEEYNNLDRASLAKWLTSEAKKHEAQLGFSEANYLVERLGENQELLYNELSKLTLYDPHISKKSIDLLTDPTPQSKVFDLLDAAFAGKKNRALELYEDQRAQKVEPQAILAMIAWQLQILSLVKTAKERSSDQIAKDASINPYPVKKAATMANKLSDDKLRQMVSEALEIDIKGKTTSLDLDEALKTYITTL
jgi:DNA polymerase-3 subunit delta